MAPCQTDSLPPCQLCLSQWPCVWKVSGKRCAANITNTYLSAHLCLFDISVCVIYHKYYILKSSTCLEIAKTTLIFSLEYISMLQKVNILSIGREVDNMCHCKLVLVSSTVVHQWEKHELPPGKLDSTTKQSLLFCVILCFL